MYRILPPLYEGAQGPLGLLTEYLTAGPWNPGAPGHLLCVISVKLEYIWSRLNTEIFIHDSYTPYIFY